LSNLNDARLRSHGAVAEARVPFILNRPLNQKYSERAAHGPLKSHFIFDFAINGVVAGV
jgi:phosphonoacetate hydrolase